MANQRNPFIVGGPVPPKRFIGREKEVKTILDRLASPAHGSTAVSGEALIGKTSFLHYISSPEIAERSGLSPEKCTFISVDIQTVVPFSPLEFWHYVLKSLAARRACDPHYIEGFLREDDVRGFELGELFDRLARDGALVVLLLDEFERIVEHVSAGDLQFLYLLRALINRRARGLALVLASRKPLEDLCREMRFAGSPFPTSFYSLSLNPFSLEETNRLIDVYMWDTGITFSDRDREFAYETSRGHPYWLQKVCFKLFQRHVEKVTWRKTVDETDLEEIAEEMRAEREAKATSEERKDERRRPSLSWPFSEETLKGGRENEQIFLSYAREDEGMVKKLYQKLSDAGFKPWMDTKDILPGERWQSNIREAIRDSDFFLVCLSANSIDKRGWVQREMKQALDLWQEKLDSDIYLIPVRLEDCKMPESLRDFQWVNLFEADGWTRLVKAIRVGIERRKSHSLAQRRQHRRRF